MTNKLETEIVPWVPPSLLKIKIEAAEEIDKLANSLAQRWVGAWKNQGESAINVKINWKEKRIYYNSYYVDGIYSLTNNKTYFDLKYLEDDSTLEKDSIEWKRNDDREKMAKINEIEELKKTKDVDRFLKLTAAQGYMNPYISYFC